MVTYTTAQKVVDLVQFNQGSISSTTRPSTSVVEDFILRAENWLEQATGHAWTAKTITNEFHDIKHDYQWEAGIPIFLAHRSLNTFNTTSGDKIEVWNGSAYDDWVTAKSEGRASDFWADYEQGILYLKQQVWFPPMRKSHVRVTYRYGEATVPKLVEDIVTKKAAIDIIQSWNLLASVPEGLDRISLQQKIENFKKDIDEGVEMLKEFRIGKM